MTRILRRIAMIAAATVLLFLPSRASVALTGTQNILVLRVVFSDFPNMTRFTDAQVQTFLDNLNQLWGKKTSYGTITLNFRVSTLYAVPGNSATYLDSGCPATGCPGDISTAAGFNALVGDAVAAAPAGLDWTNLRGIMILFADVRPNGFHRGQTLPASVDSPIGTLNLRVSIVGETPGLNETSTWGRWGHEIGHELQTGGPPHPSNYASLFEVMDGLYPGQSGIFEKQATMGFPDWIPTGKYKLVTPPAGGTATIFAEENPPALQPDFQGIKASLTFGGPQLYYLISVRRRTLGDDLFTGSTPNGIPDEGVLIERVLEGGDPSINDCPPDNCFRWVNVIGNGKSNTLWHEGDTFFSATDGISIAVRKKVDDDHYTVNVAYGEQMNEPDVGLNSWLAPPGNTYETTDIWVDSPLNGYDTYKYGNWSDLMGGTVPVGNGDDPAIGQTNRVYARVRNFGAMPATDVQVTFEISDPPGVGVNDSTTWKVLGQVTSAQFPDLAQIMPGDHTDVFLEWVPNFPLTPEQIMAGQFSFHTCLRVRLNHVTGETFFANQDGDGQQENVAYFQATPGGGGAPGTPGAPQSASMHLHNPSPSASKQIYLSVRRDNLPNSWQVRVNGGNPLVTLAPNQHVDVPVVVRQTATEPVGSRYSFRVYASTMVTFTNPDLPHPHSEAHPLGGVDFKVAVLRKTRVECKSTDRNVVRGRIVDFQQSDKRVPVRVLVQGVDDNGKFIRHITTLAEVQNNGTFTARFRETPRAKRGVCLFAGTQEMASSGSAFFPLQ
jgi:hypothetical protein